MTPSSPLTYGLTRSVKDNLIALTLVIGSLMSAFGYGVFFLFDRYHMNYESAWWLPANYLIIFGAIFLGYGIMGLFFRIPAQIGIASSIGVLLTATSILVINVGAQTIEGFVKPWLESAIFMVEPPPVNPLFAWTRLILPVGVITIGISLVHKKILPAWNGVLLVLSGIMFEVAFFLPVNIPIDDLVWILAYIGFAFMGVDMWRSNATPRH